jgi:hypothetical protein
MPTGSITGVTSIATPWWIEFDATTTFTPPTQTGTLYWDKTDSIQTLNLVMEGGNAIQQIGEEQYYRIKCSAAITEGQAVMFTGTVGASGGLTGAPASGLTAATASYFMGIATESGALNDWIYVTSFGLVRGINTTGGAEAWVDGQILFYNPAVAGGLTKTVPTAPAAKIQAATVVYASAGSGSLFVRPTVYPILENLSDVESTAAAARDLIQYQAGGYWLHTQPSTVTGMGSAINLAGGVTGQVPYQTGVGATNFVTNGVTGQVLLSNGTLAPTWGSVAGGTF